MGTTESAVVHIETSDSEIDENINIKKPPPLPPPPPTTPPPVCVIDNTISASINTPPFTHPPKRVSEGTLSVSSKLTQPLTPVTPPYSIGGGSIVRRDTVRDSRGGGERDIDINLEDNVYTHTHTHTYTHTQDSSGSLVVEDDLGHTHTHTHTHTDGQRDAHTHLDIHRDTLISGDGKDGHKSHLTQENLDYFVSSEGVSAASHPYENNSSGGGVINTHDTHTHTHTHTHTC
eukprot:GHVR01028336.1.p1 GENE.GHVR01028336.1~~GHVR01028336.1.p1  ORF type:complete len:232 (-),score=163.48 GHVR01028336.1:54-749(-)